MRTQRQPVRSLDKLDHKILRLLQQDGRMAMKDLAEQVGLSVTPCIERVKRMERDGVITGYHARVNPAELGAALLVFVEITLDHKSGNMFDQFRRGDFAPLLGWMRTHIHSQGSLKAAEEIAQAATGKPLEPANLLAYLRAKYGELYQLS